MREAGTIAETFGIRRVYDAPADDAGCRVLVDRLWPRGVSKVDARVDLLYGARDPEVNHAGVLLEFIVKRRWRSCR